jgi:predicted kinase
MNEPSSPVFCPLQTLCKFSLTRLCKTDANQDDAGGKELRDRVIAGRYVPGCGKSKSAGRFASQSAASGADAAGRRIDQTAPSSLWRFIAKLADYAFRPRSLSYGGRGRLIRLSGYELARASLPPRVEYGWITSYPLCRSLGAHAGYLFQFEKAIMTEITKIPPTLIVLSGLPGSGKTVLAESLSRALSVPVFSIDPIEAAMWRAGLDKTETGVAAYEVTRALADEHLRLRHSVIVDAVNPAEAPRAAWRNLAAKHRVSLKIIECVCSDETMHRQRIEGRVRSIAGTHELTWARLLQRRAEYEAWTDPRLVLDTSRTSPAQLLTQALNYAR